MSNKELKHFNIRVYGLFINDEQEVLVSDEYQLDTLMTKFPGGGLEFGEGTIACLRREMREECQQEITAIEHFYTTDFFQQALYFDDHQLISIYYKAKLEPPINFNIGRKAFDFEEQVNGKQSFRWVPLHQVSAEMFTFPIDKHVAQLLTANN